MNKVKLTLLTRDNDYAAYFSNYMINPDNSEKFSAKIYTDIEVFRKNTRNQKQHVLITDFKLKPDDVITFEKVVQLSEIPLAEDDKEKAIFKFQPLTQFLSQILSIYYETNEKLSTVFDKNKKENVISFYSGSGAAGKTILSLCLAKYLAQQGKNVFYLNFEQLHTTNLYFKEEKESSTEVFYYLKNNNERLLSKIESLKSKDAFTNIDYFSLPAEPEEMQTLTSEQVNGLITSLRDTQNYDFILIDLESSLHKRNSAAMETSDEVFWILNSDEASFSRSQNILDNNLLGSNIDRSKIHFMLNKVGQNMFEGADNYNFSIEDRIAFKQNWLEMSEGTKLLEDNELGKMLAKHLKSGIEAEAEVASFGYESR